MSNETTPTWTTRNPRAFLCDTCGQGRSKHRANGICPIATDYLVELIDPDNGEILDHQHVAATSADAAREITKRDWWPSDIVIGRALPDTRKAI